MRISVTVVFFSLMACVRSYGQLNQKDAFNAAIDSVVGAINCGEPDEGNPVNLKAILMKAGRPGEAAVVMKVRIALGWHLYAYVPGNMPFIATQLRLKLPPGVTTEGEWDRSPSSPSVTDQGVMVWETEATFVMKVHIGKSAKGILKAGLYYQTCNSRQCLPPKERIVNLSL